LSFRQRSTPFFTNWVTPEEFFDLDYIPTMDEEVELAFGMNFEIHKNIYISVGHSKF